MPDEPKDSPQPICSYKGKGFSAKMTANATTGECTVRQGSQARKREIANIAHKPALLRKTLIEKGILREHNGALVFSRDYTFSSVITAAQVIGGGSGNSYSWRMPDGHFYKNWKDNASITRNTLPEKTNEVPDELMDSPQPICSYSGKGFSAKMTANTTTGACTVRRGSRARKREIANIYPGAALLRATLIEKGILHERDSALVFSRDYTFLSVITAAQVIGGGSGNSYSWRLPDGHFYKNWLDIGPELYRTLSNRATDRSSRPICSYKGQGFAAKMTANATTGECVVRQGSRARKREIANIAHKPALLRKTLTEKGILREDNGALVFSRDYTFPSITAAAHVVGGGGGNSYSWCLPDGRAYKNWIDAG